MTHVAEAVVNGIRPNDVRLSANDRQIILFLDSVRSKAWTVSGLRKPPASWLAVRLDMPLRTVERSLQHLESAGAIERLSTTYWDKRVKATRTSATYRLTADFRRQCEAYARYVVGAAKGTSDDPKKPRLSPYHAKQPEMTLEELYRKAMADTGQSLPWEDRA